MSARPCPTLLRPSWITATTTCTRSKAAVEVKFDGIVILDHTPAIVGGRNPEYAYGFAYMKALFNRAHAESMA